VGSSEVIPEQEAPAPDQPAPPDWQWRTFPVLFAFAVGAFSLALVALVIRGSFLTLFYVALFGVAFGLAHIVTRTVVRRR
jgi:hypothetical protein